MEAVVLNPGVFDLVAMDGNQEYRFLKFLGDPGTWAVLATTFFDRSNCQKRPDFTWVILSQCFRKS